jgi:hypothetical protein
MKGQARNQKKELLVYLALWIILFIAPLLGAYIGYTRSEDTNVFPWIDLWLIWRHYIILFVAFLIHNFLLAPLLIFHQKRIPYSIGIALLLSAFIATQYIAKPKFEPRHPRFHEMIDRPAHKDNPPDMPFFADDRPRPHSDKMPEIRGHKPPTMFREHDIVSVIILLLIMGMNLGIKYYFRHRQDRERLITLERQNLEQQLEYLKYQINPHFLMNTLNNIHALVDIDPEQAKDTIVELSKIMRFVLYEGSKQKVPLRQELIFLDNYIQLMRMRVTDKKVDITVEIPQVIPDREIPPLMMITFVENAFKHGVSYQRHSFIDINIQVTDNHLIFYIRNSKVPQNEDRHGGLGLKNVKRRLELIYGTNYTLDIKDEDDTYTVNLKLPL